MARLGYRVAFLSTKLFYSMYYECVQSLTKRTCKFRENLRENEKVFKSGLACPEKLVNNFLTLSLYGLRHLDYLDPIL